MKQKFKELIPHLIVVAVFVVISALYFYPEFDGKELVQGDNVQAAGMSQEINQHLENTGEYSAWTNSMFGGMPAYQIKAPESFNIHLILQRFLHLFLPYSTMAIFFVYLLGFYVLLTSLDFKRGMAFVGSLAFALSSYNVIIIIAGHITKCYAIAYMAPVIAGLIYIYKKNYIAGFFLMAFALGIEIACNHTQILYYLAVMCGVFFVWKFVMMFRDRADNPDWLKTFGKSTAVAAIAVVFAVLPNITNLWTTYEYSKYSTRSQSELSSKQVSSGLDKSYAFDWCYGKMECFNMFIPDFKGGESAAFSADELNAVKDPQMRQYVGQSFGRYWGDQPFTSGPVYLGAVVVFLFVLGMFIIANPAKWWLFISFVLSILMSLGYNGGFVSDLFFDYFPMFNKFRSVSMALVIAQVAVPFVAMMALKEIADRPAIINEKKKQFLAAAGITAGLCLIFLLIPSLSGSFLSKNEAEQLGQLVAQNPQYQQLFDGVEQARISVFRSDAWRTLVFVVLAAAVIFMHSKNVIKGKAFVVVIGILIAFDMWTVDLRYLSSDDYKNKSDVSQIFRPSFADEFIRKDTDPDFRVLNMTANVFNDAKTSYYHKSVGGYHGAKMRRYQEFVDTLLGPAIGVSQMLARENPQQAVEYLTSNPAVNMLNTKFIIVNPSAMPVVNMNTYGNAWFVNKFDAVTSADQEIGSLKRTDPRQTAVINKNIFADYMKNLPQDQIYATDSSIISLAEYKPNYLKYNAIAYKDRLAVFSEIYYPKGWQAYIDGKEVEHICADYILRALVVPQGQHTIEFKFAPTSVKAGKIISALASALIILALIAFLVKTYVLDPKKIQK